MVVSCRVAAGLCMRILCALDCNQFRLIVNLHVRFCPEVLIVNYGSDTVLPHLMDLHKCSVCVCVCVCACVCVRRQRYCSSTSHGYTDVHNTTYVHAFVCMHFSHVHVCIMRMYASCACIGRAGGSPSGPGSLEARWAP